MAIERLNLKKPEGRYDKYHYLRFYRPNEKISRVDKLSIMLYWDDYDFYGQLIRRNHLLFYPSNYGAEEIKEQQHKTLEKKLKQLMKFGNCWWDRDVDFELTPDNWTLDKYPKTMERLSLKSKPKTRKKHSLKPKVKRMKLKSND